MNLKRKIIKGNLMNLKQKNNERKLNEYKNEKGL